MKTRITILLICAALLCVTGCPSSGQIEFPEIISEEELVTELPTDDNIDQPEELAAEPVSEPAAEPEVPCGTDDPVKIALPSDGAVSCFGDPNTCSFTMTATGGGTSYIWEITGLPGGLAYETGTGEVSGVIPRSEPLPEGWPHQSFTVTAKVHDTACDTNVDEATFQLKVTWQI